MHRYYYFRCRIFFPPSWPARRGVRRSICVPFARNCSTLWVQSRRHLSAPFFRRSWCASPCTVRFWPALDRHWSLQSGPWKSAQACCSPHVAPADWGRAWRSGSANWYRRDRLAFAGSREECNPSLFRRPWSETFSVWHVFWPRFYHNRGWWCGTQCLPPQPATSPKWLGENFCTTLGPLLLVWCLEKEGWIRCLRATWMVHLNYLTNIRCITCIHSIKWLHTYKTNSA